MQRYKIIYAVFVLKAIFPRIKLIIRRFFLQALRLIPVICGKKYSRISDWLHIKNLVKMMK
jgi:hypothetical protein